jgi:hypothetical protein
VNPYLVGSANQVELEVTPLANGEPIDDFSGVLIEATVRCYEKGMPVAPDSGPVVRALPFMDRLGERVKQAQAQNLPLAVPQRLVERFDNDVVSFAPELLMAAPLADLEAVTDYGLRLRDLMRAGDVDALVAELAGKVRAYAAGYDEPEDRMRQSLVQVLRDEYAARGFRADFERGDIALAPCAEGRLCELRRAPASAFIETEPDESGNPMRMPVVVGLHDGKLGVVR